MSIQEIKKALRKSFQGILKNIVSLANDSTLEDNYKVLKIGEEPTTIELSKTDVKIHKLDTNTLTVKGDNVLTGIVDGQILGYTRLEGDLSTISAFEIQDALTVEDDTHQITFKTPPSEYVEIELCCHIDIGTTDTEINVGLSSASATSGYSALSAELEYDSGAGTMFSDDEVDDDMLVVKFVCKATHLASVGSSNTFYIGFSTGGVTKTATIRYGYRASHGLAYPPMVIKATALPATIYDGQ